MPGTFFWTINGYINPKIRYLYYDEKKNTCESSSGTDRGIHTVRRRKVHRFTHESWTHSSMFQEISKHVCYSCRAATCFQEIDRQQEIGGQSSELRQALFQNCIHTFLRYLNAMNTVFGIMKTSILQSDSTGISATKKYWVLCSDLFKFNISVRPPGLFVLSLYEYF